MRARRAARVGLIAAALATAGCPEFQTTRYEAPQKPFGYLEVDGVRVHYREVKPPDGEWTETIVFVHGYAGGLVSWLYAQPALGARYRTISLDLKGFGLTDKFAGDYSTTTEADLVVKVMDALDVDRAHLVAHSWGCAVALDVASRYPDRVDKLVLASGFVYPDQLNGFLRWSQVPGVGEVLYTLFYNEQLEARYTWSYFEPERHVTVKGFDYLHEFQASPGVVAAALAVVRGMDLEALGPRLGRVDKPALLVWGEQDRVSPPRYGERLVTDLPRARLVKLARSGHSVMIERAGTFHTLVAEFLGP